LRVVHVATWLVLDLHAIQCTGCNAAALHLEFPHFTNVWRVLDGNESLTQKISEFIKLVEITMTHVIKFVEDERTFSSLAFLKLKLRASLVENLEVIVEMYSQKVFTLENFLYQQVFEEWFSAGDRGRYLAHA